MAFGSNTFPLGPNGEYPKQRISNFNSHDIAPSNRVEDVYRTNRQSRLPVVERDFTSSLNKVQRKMKQGKMMREGQDEDKFRPRFKMRKHLANTNVLSHGPRFKMSHLEKIDSNPGIEGLGSIDGWLKNTLAELFTAKKGRRMPAKKVGRIRLNMFNGKA